MANQHVSQSDDFSGVFMEKSDGEVSIGDNQPRGEQGHRIFQNTNCS